MNAQKLVGIFSANVVKVYGYTQLYVRVDRDNRVVAAELVDNGVQQGEDRLLLQFVLMEKLVPALTMDRNSGPVLTPGGLAAGDEREILRLGEQMVNAMTALHSNEILHRDIKLENIFYDPRHRRYKLGDFGIAKATQDGLASTVAFIKGYGAPEIVGMPEDRYDCTADIYSLGMVLFLLLNDLRFPDSDCYQVNPAAQYCRGYVLPAPACGSEIVAQLIRKMCAYNPDDRPQSMKEVSIQLDRLSFSPAMRSRAQEGASVTLLGSALLTAGIGILLLRSGYPESKAFFDTLPWLSPLLMLQGSVFLCQGIYSAKNPFISASLREMQSNLLWGSIVALYGCLILLANLPVREAGTMADFFLVTVPKIARQLQVDKIGIFGLLICGLWWLRDRIRMNSRNGEEPPVDP